MAFGFLNNFQGQKPVKKPGLSVDNKPAAVKPMTQKPMVKPMMQNPKLGGKAQKPTNKPRKFGLF